LASGLKQPINFIVVVNIGLCTSWAVGQQPGGRNLRSRISCTTVARENTHEAQAPSPLSGLSSAALGCPPHRQIRGDKHLALSLNKINVSGQQATFVNQFESHCLA
jgi:hypothetical protein